MRTQDKFKMNRVDLIWHLIVVSSHFAVNWSLTSELSSNFTAGLKIYFDRTEPYKCVPHLNLTKTYCDRTVLWPHRTVVVPYSNRTVLLPYRTVTVPYRTLTVPYFYRTVLLPYRTVTVPYCGTQIWSLQKLVKSKNHYFVFLLHAKQSAESGSSTA